MTIRIRIIESIEFGEGYGLNHREALARTVFQKAFSFFAVGAMKEFPRRIAQIKKWLAVRRDDEAFVLTDFQTRLSESSQRESHQNDRE